MPMRALLLVALAACGTSEPAPPSHASAVVRPATPPPTDEALLRAALAAGWHLTDPAIPRLLEGKVSDEDLNDPAMRLALAMSTDAVRAHLVQRAERVLGADPGDAVLMAHHAAHPERFRGRAVLEVEHRVWMGPDAEDRAHSLAPADDVPGIPQGATTAEALEQRYGIDVRQVPSGDWSPPHRTALGVHRVRVISRAAGKQPPFRDVRAQVLADWRRERASLTAEP